MPNQLGRIPCRNVLLVCCALLGAAGSLAGCASEEAAPTESSIFVGEVPATGAAIALVVGADEGTASGEAAVYVCDGLGTSRWFFGTITGNVIEAEAEAGGFVQATITGSEVTGTVDLPGLDTADFTAALATGVAGIYLVDLSETHAEGFSAAGGEIQADLDGSTVSGTVTPPAGAPTALSGTAALSGEGTVATWIVQASGVVKGTRTGTAGGGNCSIWTKIRSLMLGVDCSFL